MMNLTSNFKDDLDNSSLNSKFSQDLLMFKSGKANLLSIGISNEADMEELK